jgi:hypothetical protein
MFFRGERMDMNPDLKRSQGRVLFGFRGVFERERWWREMGRD